MEAIFQQTDSIAFKEKLTIAAHKNQS